MTASPHPCLAPGCQGLAMWGFGEGGEPARRRSHGVLWACADHRPEAEARWLAFKGRVRGEVAAAEPTPDYSDPIPERPRAPEQMGLEL